MRCVGSYVCARVRPPKDQTNYEGWLVARFGWRLYRTFFKTYTEKVWGVPVSQMPADWAAQRVKGLSLGNAIVNALTPSRNQKDITSLIEEFQYPKYGPGMMWEVCRDKVEAKGSKVVMETRVTKIRHEGGKAVEVEAVTAGGGTTSYPVTDVISSMPIRQLLEAMDPPPPAEVLAAAELDSSTATSSPSRSSCPPRRWRGTTTGSTSTPPRSRPCASRTSGRGRRTW